MIPSARIRELYQQAKLEVDPSVDQRILGTAYDRLDHVTQSRPTTRRLKAWRFIMHSKYGRIVAALAMVIALLLLAQYLTGGPSETPQPDVEDVIAQGTTENQETPKETRQALETTQTELALAEALFSRQDQVGLLALLETGQEATQITVAGYLGEIGAASALPALQKLADVWDGKGANPFQAAINAIQYRQRSEPPESIDNNDVSALEPNITSPRVFEAKGVLSGLVTDAKTGEPIAGIEIVLAHTDYSAITDEHGFYAIGQIRESGYHKISVKAKEYLGLGSWSELPAVALSSDRPTVKHFQLTCACRAKVKVVDEQGNPIEGVRVYASALEAGLNGPPPNFAVGDEITDKDGRVTMGRLKPSQQDYQMIAHHPEYALALATVKVVDPGAVGQARLVMKKGLEVQGYAEYSDGVPAEGASVFLKPDWWHNHAMLTYMSKEGSVDAQGLFTLPNVVKGKYDLHVGIQAENSDSLAYSFIRQAQLPLAEGELLVVRIPQNSPQSLASISGTILWATEKRSKHFTVEARCSETGVSQHAELDGRAESFAIDSLEPGIYTLKFFGVNLKDTLIENVEAPGPGVDVVLAYQTLRLQGIVVAAETQEPVPQFKARFANAKPLQGRSGSITGTNHWVPCVNGRFNMRPMFPGIYQVQILAPGYAVAFSPPMRTDETDSVTIELVRGGRVKGRVKNTAGEPVSGASVMSLASVGGDAYRQGESFLLEQEMPKTIDGLFELEHLPPGYDTLSVTHPDYLPAIVPDIEVISGQTNEQVEIVLDSGISVEGFVFSAQGQPEANVVLHFQDDPYGSGDRQVTAVTDANGYYRANCLPPGKMCYVRRANHDSALGVVRRAYRIPERQMGRLDVGGRTWVSGVLEKDGVQLSATRIRLSHPEGSRSATMMVNGLTDDSGRFVLFGVPVGRYGIYYQSPDKPEDHIRATIVNVGRDSVDLGVLSLQTTSIEVTLDIVEAATKQLDWQVYLREGSEFRGRIVGKVRRPSLSEPFFIIQDVPPGSYQVLASPQGSLIRKVIEVEDSGNPLQVTLEIPRLNARVAGTFLTDTWQPLVLWDDRGTVMAYLSPKDGKYSIENLPAGHYTIGHAYLENRTPVVDFDLAQGQDKRLDIDLRDGGSSPGAIHMFAVDSQGTPLNHADIWLEDSLGQVFRPRKGVTPGFTLIAPAGHYTLIVQCAGYQRHEEPMVLSPKVDYFYLSGNDQDYKVVSLEEN